MVYYLYRMQIGTDLMSNWRSLERELVDLLRQQVAAIEDIDGIPHLVDYDMDGRSYPSINLQELAQALDARGYTRNVDDLHMSIEGIEAIAHLNIRDKL